MPTAATNTWLAANRLDPLYHPEDALAQNIKLAASLTYAKGQVLGEQLGVNAVQSIHASAQLTGGSYTLTYRGATTTALQYTDTAATVQAALEALPDIGVGNVVCAGGLLSAATPVDITVTFQNALGYQAVGAITDTPTSVTGGTISIVATTTGTIGTKGAFTKYVYTNTDGSQVAKCVLQYGCTTDSNGQITMVGEFGTTRAYAPAYFQGTFRTEDLTGLDANALTGLSAALVSGTVYHGVLRI